MKSIKAKKLLALILVFGMISALIAPQLVLGADEVIPIIGGAATFTSGTVPPTPKTEVVVTDDSTEYTYTTNKFAAGNYNDPDLTANPVIFPLATVPKLGFDIIRKGTTKSVQYEIQGYKAGDVVDTKKIENAYVSGTINPDTETYVIGENTSGKSGGYLTVQHYKVDSAEFNALPNPTFTNNNSSVSVNAGVISAIFKEENKLGDPISKPFAPDGKDFATTYDEYMGTGTDITTVDGVRVSNYICHDAVFKGDTTKDYKEAMKAKGYINVTQAQNNSVLYIFSSNYSKVTLYNINADNSIGNVKATISSGDKLHWYQVNAQNVKIESGQYYVEIEYINIGKGYGEFVFGLSLKGYAEGNGNVGKSIPIIYNTDKNSNVLANLNNNISNINNIFAGSANFTFVSPEAMAADPEEISSANTIEGADSNAVMATIPFPTDNGKAIPGKYYVTITEKFSDTGSTDVKTRKIVLGPFVIPDLIPLAGNIPVPTDYTKEKVNLAFTETNKPMIHYFGVVDDYELTYTLKSVKPDNGNALTPNGDGKYYAEYNDTYKFNYDVYNKDGVQVLQNYECSGTVNVIDRIAPDVISVTGVAIVSTEEGEPDETINYTAVLTDGKYVINCADKESIPDTITITAKDNKKKHSNYPTLDVASGKLVLTSENGTDGEWMLGIKTGALAAIEASENIEPGDQGEYNNNEISVTYEFIVADQLGNATSFTVVIIIGANPPPVIKLPGLEDEDDDTIPGGGGNPGGGGTSGDAMLRFAPIDRGNLSDDGALSLVRDGRFQADFAVDLRNLFTDENKEHIEKGDVIIEFSSSESAPNFKIVNIVNKVKYPWLTLKTLEDGKQCFVISGEEVAAIPPAEKSALMELLKKPIRLFIDIGKGTDGKSLPIGTECEIEISDIRFEEYLTEDGDTTPEPENSGTEDDNTGGDDEYNLIDWEKDDSKLTIIIVKNPIIR